MSVSIFFCYAHEDEALLNKLKSHLRPLQRQGLIDVWYDRDISAGTEWEREIKQHLNAAQIILLLVSPDFMDSDYCYGIEMQRALERHQRGEARVIPVVMRPVYWQGILGHLQALPTDAKPVRSWSNVDEALYNVAEGIRTVVVQLGTKPVSPPEVLPSQASKRKSADASLTVLPPPPARPLPSLKPEALSLLRTLTGHTSSVGSVAFSPDGQTLASGSDDGTIKLWNVASGSRDQTIKLWNVVSGRKVRTLRGHTSPVYSVAFSPDGQTLASGSDDETIKLWNVATGQEVRTITGHTSPVYSVAFSPDRHTLASLSYERIKLWNVVTGQEVRTITGHAPPFHNVAFSPDGHTLASGDENGRIKLWNVATGQEVQTLTGSGYIGSVGSVAFSPDGHTLAGGSYERIKLWNVVTGQEVRTITGLTFSVSSMAFSPDGHTLASDSYKTIKLWDVATGQEVQTLTGHTSSVGSVAFSPDGQTLASGSDDGTIKLWGKK